MVTSHARHHRLRVIELERVGGGEAHRALDRLAAEMQRSHAARLAHFDAPGTRPDKLAQHLQGLIPP
jgi:hypothetical protein